VNASPHDGDAADSEAWGGSRWFRDLPYPEPPPGLQERVMASIATYERGRRIRRATHRIGGIATVMLLGLLVAISNQRRRDQCKKTIPLGMLLRRKERLYVIRYWSYAR